MSTGEQQAIPYSVVQKCYALVHREAEKRGIPAVYITAHVRNPVADKARKSVQRKMIVKLKMKRCQVAAFFGRDLRRVRKSVLGV